MNDHPTPGPLDYSEVVRDLARRASDLDLPERAIQVIELLDARRGPPEVMAEVYERFLKGKVGHDHALWKIRRRRRDRIDRLAGATKRIEALLHRRDLQLAALRQRVEGLGVRVHGSWVATVSRHLALGGATPRLQKAWRRGLILSPLAAEALKTSHLTPWRRVGEVERRLNELGGTVLELRSRRLGTVTDRLHGQWRRFTMDLEREAGRIVRQDGPPVEFSLELGTRDRRLIDRWSSSDGEEEQERLSSARHAEKAVDAYYRQLGHSVEDVSIQQLDDAALEDSGWKTHDLLVDERPLDVKNVRFSREGALNEHLWRDHKAKRGGQPVAIVGVASEKLLDLSVARRAIVLG